MKDLILQELHQSHSVLTEFMNNEKNIEAIQKAAEIMIACIKNGGKIIACGNGGSMSDAMHFASELTGRYRDNRDPLPAIAISDPGHLSCVANDYGYNEIFSRWIKAHERPNDVLLMLTSSGNSDNIISAIRNTSIPIVLISGNNGGKAIKSLYLNDYLPKKDCAIIIPHEGTADRTQELTIIIIHILVMLIEKGVFDEQ